IRQPLDGEAGEESGQAGVVVLPPPLAGMMMALGTFNPDAEEELTDRAAGELRLVDRLEERGRAFALHGALRGDDFPDHRIVGAVLGELLAEPAGDTDGPLRRDLDFVRSQNVPPLHGPVVGILRSLQESRYHV